MIGILDELRGMLEDLGGGLGLTDPASGEAVVRLGFKKKAAKKRFSPKRRKAKRAKRRKS
jgi:hypothetical protein